MKIGDIVKHRITGEIGLVRYSAYGVSVHTYNEASGRLGRTIGEPVHIAAQYWEVIAKSNVAHEYADQHGLRISEEGYVVPKDWQPIQMTNPIPVIEDSESDLDNDDDPAVFLIDQHLHRLLHDLEIMKISRIQSLQFIEKRVKKCWDDV